MPASSFDSAAAEDLRRQFPAWRIWASGGTWLARRRGDFRQSFTPGAPLYALTAPSTELLRGRLEHQESLSEIPA